MVHQSISLSPQRIGWWMQNLQIGVSAHLVYSIFLSLSSFLFASLQIPQPIRQVLPQKTAIPLQPSPSTFSELLKSIQTETLLHMRKCIRLCMMKRNGYTKEQICALPLKNKKTYFCTRKKVPRTLRALPLMQQNRQELCAVPSIVLFRSRHFH